MRAIICDMCERMINDEDEKNRKETEYEVHVIRCEHAPEGVEVRRHFDLCRRCTQIIGRISRDPAALNRFWIKEGYL